MSKSRSFSIYLLKNDFNAENALTDDHKLDESESKLLPKGSSVFVLDSTPYPPWWKGYFEIDDDLTQVSKGALVFLSVHNRWFALSFGHVAHNLKDESYEYDFGLRVTLNCVEPKALRSTDSIDPGLGRRQRTQLPIGSDLTLFDFDKDSAILRSLTGRVKEEHRELFKQATGASNLRVSSNISANELTDLCDKLLSLYESEDYKAEFPDIQNIVPVRDPVVIGELDARLFAAFRDKADALSLIVPDMINYQENLGVTFAGAGASLQYDDVYIAHYYEYLDSHEIALVDIDKKLLTQHRLVLVDENGAPRDQHRIYKALIFDTTFDGVTFHLSEGNWYKVEPSYITKIENYLDPLCVDVALPPYNHGSEGAYNKAVASADSSKVCLDETNISPAGQTAIEPCDLYSVVKDVAVFEHVKISTLSSKLSHLFNQGSNAIELLRLETSAQTKLADLIKAQVSPDKLSGFLEPLSKGSHSVIYAIITHKDKTKKSRNLPLFSRISLMRNLKSLQAAGVSGSFGFVADVSAKSAGKKKVTKKKSK